MLQYTLFVWVGEPASAPPRQFCTAASDRRSVALDSGVVLAGNCMVFV